MCDKRILEKLEKYRFYVVLYKVKNVLDCNVIQAVSAAKLFYLGHVPGHIY